MTDPEPDPTLPGAEPDRHRKDERPVRTLSGAALLVIFLTVAFMGAVALFNGC